MVVPLKDIVDVAPDRVIRLMATGGLTGASTSPGLVFTYPTFCKRGRVRNLKVLRYCGPHAANTAKYAGCTATSEVGSGAWRQNLRSMQPNQA